MNILSALLIIIPIILLLICSFKYRERFSTVYSQIRNIDLGKAKPRLVATNPAHKIPFQIEQFENGDDKWKKLKYFRPRNIDFGKDQPRLVATDPSHTNVIEGFSVSDIFSKPNNKLDIDTVSPNTNSMKSNNVSSLEKQFQSNLENKSNEQVTSEMEQIALNNNNSNTGVPMINSTMQRKGPNMPEKQDFQIKAMQCQFFPDTCPAGWSANGSFSVNGMSQDVTLNCGDAANFQNCEAVAEIKNKKVNNIIVTNKGGGYLPGQPPSVEIVSADGMGSGATAECVVDDDGRIQLIKVIDGGSNYTETPTIKVNNPNMNRTCNLCCKT